MTEQELAVKIQFDDDVTEEYVLTLAELPKYGVQPAPSDDEFGEQGLGLIGAVVILGLAHGLAHLVMSIVEKVRGGVVIDLTGDIPDIRSDRDLPRGWMVVLTKDGIVELKKEDLPPDGLERVVTIFLKLGKDAMVATVEAAVKAVKGVTGSTDTAEG
jgi:hypothetical protein